MLSKVLFIDDDSVALMLNRMLVERTNFAKETITALNGRLALDYYSTLLSETAGPISAPELILVDLNMPVLDGWDFLQEFSKPLYSPFHRTKIVILSSSINPEDLKRSKEFPMVIEFITKPVTVETLDRLKKYFP